MQGEREPEYRWDGDAEMKHVLYASYWGRGSAGSAVLTLAYVFN